jgi:hypothetical protein
MVKLVFSWNMGNVEEHEYSEFIQHEFAPRIMRMGIRLTEAWYTLYGSGPQIIMPAVAADRIALEAIMDSEEWSTLTSKLSRFVVDYKCRVVG